MTPKILFYVTLLKIYYYFKMICFNTFAPLIILKLYNIIILFNKNYITIFIEIFLLVCRIDIIFNLLRRSFNPLQNTSLFIYTVKNIICIKLKHNNISIVGLFEYWFQKINYVFNYMENCDIEGQNTGTKQKRGFYFIFYKQMIQL
uniref:Transmembrane protein n=1 Tax=Heterorhabditis bacteriophora TaxID=37862 RepID=A0A1I7WUI7_HETBA